jgi:APA family basic amino acid/polyamine antiporter
VGRGTEQQGQEQEQEQEQRQGQGSGQSQPREIGRSLAVFVSLAAMVDAGIFVALGPAAAAAGAGLLVSLGLAGLVALGTGTSGAQLGSAVPQSGGGFTWARHFGLTRLSAASGVSFLGKAIIVQSVNALLLALFAQAIFPWLPQNVTAAVVIVAMTLLNAAGVAPTVKVQALFTSVLAAVVGVYVVLAAPSIETPNLSPVAGTGVWGLLSGAGILFFVFAGFERPAVIASKMKNPSRTIPFAIYSGFSFATLLFVLVAAVTLGVLGADALGGNTKAVLDVTRQVSSSPGVVVVAAGVIVGTLSTLGDSILGVSQVMLKMAQQRELPSWFAATAGEKNTPRHAILAVGGTIAVITLIFNLRPLLDLANVFALLWYAAVNYAAVRLPGDQRFAPRWIAWASLAGCLLLLITLSWWAILLGLAVAGVYVAVRERVKR